MLRMIILAILAAGCVGTAYFLLIDNPQGQPSSSQLLLRGLSKDAAGISQIEITDADGEVFSARLIDGTWQATHLAENQTFPVQQSALKSLVEQLSQARVIEKKTANSDYYERLGVADPNDSGGGSRQVTLIGVLSRYTLYVGKPSDYGSGQFVREKDEAHALLINTVINLPRTPTDWLQQSVMPVSPDNVSRVVITRRGQADMTFARDATGTWEWLEQDAQASLRYPTVLNDAIAAMLDLSYESLTPYQPQNWPEENGHATLQLTQTDGQQLTLHLRPTASGANYQLWIEDGPLSGDLSDWTFILAPYQANALLLQPDNVLMEPQADMPR